jgi:hypothetical protein
MPAVLVAKSVVGGAAALTKAQSSAIGAKVADSS